jgi:hypothetical protein
VGLCIGMSLSAFELFYVQGRLGTRLREVPLPLFILITTVCWVAILCALLIPVPPLIQGYTYGMGYAASPFQQDLLFSSGDQASVQLRSSTMGTGRGSGALELSPRAL